MKDKGCRVEMFGLGGVGFDNGNGRDALAIGEAFMVVNALAIIADVLRKVLALHPLKGNINVVGFLM